MPDLQLLLLRHAKAVIGEPGMADFDRPLAERGQAAARLMGRYMARHGLVPERVLCSPAQRTRQTWAIAARELPPAETLFPESLYDFGDGAALLGEIRARGGKAACLLLVGHNPAMEALALGLAGAGDPGPRGKMAEKYPTAALAVISFPVTSWDKAREGGGTLRAFVRPRDLGP